MARGRAATFALWKRTSTFQIDEENGAADPSGLQSWKVRPGIDPLDPKSENRQKLLGGLVAMDLIFPYIGNLIIPIDELIFFRGVAEPPTRKCVFFHKKTPRRFVTIDELTV